MTLQLLHSEFPCIWGKFDSLVHHSLGELEEEAVGARQMVNLLGVLVQERALLGRGRELEHLLHHVHGELLTRVHCHDGPAQQNRIE